MGTYNDLLKSNNSPAGNQEPRSEIVHEQLEDSPIRANERNSERTVFRSENRTVSLPFKRKTKRYSFEFYEDQLIRLKKLKIRADMAGESLTQSDIVRQAMDDYLKDKDL